MAWEFLGLRDQKQSTPPHPKAPFQCHPGQEGCQGRTWDQDALGRGGGAAGGRGGEGGGRGGGGAVCFSIGHSATCSPALIGTKVRGL